MNSIRYTRRIFLKNIAVSSAILGASKSAFGAPLRAFPSASYRDEAARLTLACYEHFWDETSHMFRAPVLSAETVPSDALHDRGYTLWPSLLGLHALVEGEKAHPGRYVGKIETIYRGLEQYYSEELGAYTSWLQFPGNNDAYYDDNAWVVIVFAEAASACERSDAALAQRLLERAANVMERFVVGGYDASGQPGGTRWGSDESKPNVGDRGTSSTAGSALAALVLARSGIKRDFYIQWGNDVLTWLLAHLQDGDGLIMDALAPPDYAVRRIKWTYNTGVAMRAFVEHYRLTGNTKSLAHATRLARAALNVDGALFDQTVTDPSKRQFWDGTYFVHYLVDGLVQVAQVTTDTNLSDAISDMVRRTANYTQDFLRDSADGFYWRNQRLYTIDEPHLKQWETWTQQTTVPAYDASERSQQTQFKDSPVEERPLVKTLLANGSVARLFWLATRLPAPKRA